MPWTAPSDQATGHLITAAEYNSTVLDNLTWLYPQVPHGFASTNVNLTTSTSFTPDLNNGNVQQIHVTATPGGQTLTINQTLNGPGANQTGFLGLVFRNDSASTATISWNNAAGGYFGSTSVALPTTLNGSASGPQWLLFVYTPTVAGVTAAGWTLLLKS